MSSSGGPMPREMRPSPVQFCPNSSDSRSTLNPTSSAYQFRRSSKKTIRNSIALMIALPHIVTAIVSLILWIQVWARISQQLHPSWAVVTRFITLWPISTLRQVPRRFTTQETRIWCRSRSSYLALAQIRKAMATCWHWSITMIRCRVSYIWWTPKISPSPRPLSCFLSVYGKAYMGTGLMRGTWLCDIRFHLQ